MKKQELVQKMKDCVMHWKERKNFYASYEKYLKNTTSQVRYANDRYNKCCSLLSYLNNAYIPEKVLEECYIEILEYTNNQGFGHPTQDENEENIPQTEAEFFKLINEGRKEHERL